MLKHPPFILLLLISLLLHNACSLLPSTNFQTETSQSTILSTVDNFTVVAPTPINLPSLQPSSTDIPSSPTPIWIHLAINPNNPPFEMIDDRSHDIIGYEIDLINILAEKTSVYIDYIINEDNTDLLNNTINCQYDAALTHMAIMEESKRQLLFSEPYINAGLVIVIKKENQNIQDIDDLKGKIIGISKNITFENSLEDVEIITYDFEINAFEDLNNAKIDAVITQQPVAQYIIKENPNLYRISDGLISTDWISIAVCPKRPDLVQIINDGLLILKEGELMQMLDRKWLMNSPMHVPTESP